MVEKDTYLKCHHCGKQMHVIYLEQSADVEIVFDKSAALHILRKRRRTQAIRKCLLESEKKRETNIPMNGFCANNTGPP
jgi:hypothetical protein